MDFSLFLLCVAAVLGFIAWVLWKQTESLRVEVNELRFSNKSKDVKVGKWLEDFFPFLPEMENPESFKFLGEPIDGVQFKDDEIVFWEFKTGNARLSDRQKVVKELVDARKVSWKELRVR